MIMASCKLCAWREKAQGVYKSLHASREHLRVQHPAEFEAMHKEEVAIRDAQHVLCEKFGLAVRPLGMNL